MAVEDVEMKDAKSPEEAAEPEPEKKDVNILTLEGRLSHSCLRKRTSEDET